MLEHTFVEFLLRSKAQTAVPPFPLHLAQLRTHLKQIFVQFIIDLSQLNKLFVSTL